MQQKHAYLMMAHHRMDILLELLRTLDDERNDIFLHLDKKCSEKFEPNLRYSKLFLLNRSDVRWAGYTQIQCELNLLKEALSKGNYRYFHLLTGVSFPIKSKNYIFSFFEQHDGLEFIGFDNSKDFSSRIKYTFLFNEMGKVTKKVDFQKERIRRLYLKVQKKFKIDNFKKYNMICKKGIAYWSITNECATYIVSKEDLIKKIFLKSICGDEIFIQTLIYNSNFRDKIFSMEDEFTGSLCYMPWKSSIGEREGHNFIESDYTYIKSTNCLYALKFEGPDGIQLIKRIKGELLNHED